ncbi:MAG: hypothetical protein IKN63_05585 [Bacilli bacterium]|nr:hypothetical protein [Bacilli bacterium]
MNLENLLIGIFALICGIYYSYIYFINDINIDNYVKIKGIITSVKHSRGRSPIKIYCTYQYIYEGITHTVKDKGISTTSKNVGDEITILINPNNPKKVILPMMYEDRVTYLLLGLLGLLIFIACLFI